MGPAGTGAHRAAGRLGEDNLATHRVAGVRETVEVHLLYLPPYFPDFNPIKNMWNKIKQHLRSLAPRTNEELLRATALAFVSVSQADCQGFFLHARYAI